MSVRTRRQEQAEEEEEDKDKEGAGIEITEASKKRVAVVQVTERQYTEYVFTGSRGERGWWVGGTATLALSLGPDRWAALKHK